MAHPKEYGSSYVEAIVPISNISMPCTMDYSVKDQAVFFAQTAATGNGAGQCQIERQNIDGTSRQMIAKGLMACDGIAYDWMAENLFWIDSGFRMIGVFKIANSNASKILLRDGEMKPSSIALDPGQGLMYFGMRQIAGDGKIESAWMDGTHRTVIVRGKDGDVLWPSSLSINYMEKKLYWCDTSSIERVSLNGDDRERLYVRDAASIKFYPSAIAYLNEYIFFTETSDMKIKRMELQNTSVLNG